MSKVLNGNTSKNEVKSKCLIGPKLYDKYLLVIKIALIFISVVMFAGLIIKCKNAPTETGNFVGVFCSQLITVLIQVFGWITFIFIILEQIADRNHKAKG